MSLILEALKKSEAKRRLGEAPDLATPFATKRRRSSALPLLFVAIVAAAGGGWWYLRGRAPQPAIAPANTTAVKPAPVDLTANTARAPKPAPSAPRAQPAGTDIKPNVAPAPQADASKWVAAAPLPGRGQDRPGMTQQAKKLPPNMQRVDKPTATVAAQPDVHAKQQTSVAATTPPANLKKLPPNMHRVENPEAQVAAKSDAPGKPAAAATAANPPTLTKAPKTPDMRGLTPPGEAEKTEPAVAVATATPKPEAAPGPPAPKSDVPFYYELPFNLRKALPQLHLSMHVYAANAQQRFVILNDSRLTEGEKTSDDVTLREVRPDGAILEFQGQRFFYPRDGM